jgi:hypothetical protein
MRSTDSGIFSTLLAVTKDLPPAQSPYANAARPFMQAKGAAMSRITKTILVHLFEHVRRGHPWRKRRTVTAVTVLGFLTLMAPMSWDIFSEDQVDPQETGMGQLRTQQFGWSAAIPVAADYDGDDKTDLAVLDPLAFIWYIRESSTGQTRTQQFGWSASRPVPADYDGDRKTDPAVLDPQTFTWHILESGAEPVQLLLEDFSDMVTLVDLGFNDFSGNIGDINKDNIKYGQEIWAGWSHMFARPCLRATIRLGLQHLRGSGSLHRDFFIAVWTDGDASHL